MSLKKWAAGMCTALLLCALNVLVGAKAVTKGDAVLAQAKVGQQESVSTEFITADELKAKLARNEPVTIIDVRAATGLLDSDNKIKGAIYVKLRRLKSRLAFPPLKDVPRNQEVVTYCACPNDESSVRAAQVLLESGFTRVRVLKGGWVMWQKAKGQVEPMARGI
jgi:rhodanese-related sulfurtransferase